MKLISILLSSLIISTSVYSCAYKTEEIKKEIVESNINTKKEINSNFEIFRLENGLTVYMAKNTTSPRFYAEIAVKAGSKHDPSDSTGMAHYLEHMLFKGTTEIGTIDYEKEKVLLDKIKDLYDKRFNEKDEKKRSELWSQINKLSVEASKYAIPNEIDSMYSKLGGVGLNAYTSDEETVYMVDLPKNRLEQWAIIESNRFKNPVFRLFQSELETVYEEKNRTLDNKENLIYEKIQELLYKKHPYGTQTTIGTVEHLKNPSLSKMYEYFEKYYIPNNMVILISGDIDFTETRNIIEKYFSSWKKKELKEFVPPKEDPITSKEVAHINYKGEEKVMIAFRTVPYKHEDRYALTLIDMLMDNGKTGFIRNNLVNKQIVQNAGSFPIINDDYGAQYFYAVPKKGQTMEEAENLILEQIEKIKNGDFDYDLVKGIILDFEINKKKQMETNEGLVSIMKEAALRNNDNLQDVLHFTEKLKAVSKEEIIKVAKKYFGNNYVAVYRHDKEFKYPEIKKPELEKVELNSHLASDFAKKVEAFNTKPIEPKWIDYEKDFDVSSYGNGTLLYSVKNPVNDLFTLSINYDYGDKHYKNMCNVMDELNYSSIDGLTPDKVKDELYKNGLNINFNCSDYNFSMNITGLDSYFEKGLEIGEKILWNSKLDQETFKNKVNNILKSREDQKKNINSIRSALVNYIKYDKESPFIDRTPKNELLNLNVSEYDKIKKELLKQNFEIYYIGTKDKEEVLNLLHKYHNPNKVEKPLLNPRKRPPIKLVKRNDKPIKIYFVDFKGAQSHINLIIPGKETNPNDYTINTFYNEYLDGGMGAIMFQEVREARALAYSTYAGYSQGSRLGDEDQMNGYIGTQADKTIDALKLFIDLMKNTPKSEKHFQRAMKSLDNFFRTDYINYYSIINSIKKWNDLGYNYDPRPERFEKLKEIDINKLFKYSEDKISSQNLIFTIVGDKTKININELKKIGHFQEIKLDDLFTL